MFLHNVNRVFLRPSITYVNKLPKYLIENVLIIDRLEGPYSLNPLPIEILVQFKSFFSGK
jgi:hypothetical protein